VNTDRRRRRTLFVQAVQWLMKGPEAIRSQGFKLWLSQSDAHMEEALLASMVICQVRCAGVADREEIKTLLQTLPEQPPASDGRHRQSR
jgi:hypothetical protein